MELAGVDRATAEKALALHPEIWLAVDYLLVKPTVSGDKHIPTPPKVNTGLTLEQEEICKKGRWLQDKVNAIFSVAHSQTQPVGLQPAELTEQAHCEPVELPLSDSVSELQPDAVSQIVLPVLQCELPQ